MDSAISVEISRLYVSFFNRAADPEGLEYWVGRYNEAIAQGRDPKAFLEDIADSFAQSPEAKAIYETTANPTDAQIEAYIAEAYQNMFGRTPDDEGLAYWAGRWKAEMADGKPGVRVLFEIENAARGSSNAQDVAALQNKAEVAAKFTTDFIASGAEWTEADFATAGTIVKAVDHTPESVTQANEQIADFIQDKTDPDGGQEPNQPGTGNPPVDPGPTNLPGNVTIEGEANVGSTLTATVTDGNGLAGVTPTYQWFANGKAINGATNSAYEVVAHDFGKEITVRASYVDNAGFQGTVSATSTKVSTIVEGKVVVFGTGEPRTFETVQAALAAADPNSVIAVKAGDYNDFLRVQKSGIELRGAEGANLKGGIRFDANVNGGSVEGFSISGVADNDEKSTVMVLGQNISIAHNTIFQSESNNTGVVIGGKATGAHVADNTVQGFVWFGVYVNPANSEAVVTGNNFIGNAQALVFENGTKEISGNSFDDAGTDIRVSVRKNIEVDVGAIIKDNELDSAADVTIIAASGAKITGTDGNDIIRIVGSDYGSYENPTADKGATVNAGNGNDIIVGGRGSDILNGGAGNDFIWGDNPNDNTRTSPNDYYGDDIINGGSGTNVIVLGTKGQNMKLGGQDTVVHDVADGATNLVFNFNFGPVARWDSVTSSAHGDDAKDIANADQVFDIVSFLNVSGPLKISIGQDNELYEGIVGEVSGVTTFRPFEFDFAGNTVYTGNTANFELVIEAGGSKLVFANAFSKWEVGGFLNTLYPSATVDIATTSESAIFNLFNLTTGGKVADGLVTLEDPAHVTALVGFLSTQGNFSGLTLN